MSLKETPEQAGLELIAKLSDTEYVFKDIYDDLSDYELWSEGGGANYNIIYKGMNLEFIRRISEEELNEIDENSIS